MAVEIAVLWHMHQPDYRHPETGEPVMPWVRLHASRGYTDLPTLLLEAGARSTVNVVPALLLQLQAYAAGGSDAWERLSRIPAESLTGTQRRFIRAHFFHGNEKMRRVSAHFSRLEAEVRAGGPLTVQDYRDIQVWSNLAWMGVVARRTPLVQGLLGQQQGFSHDQLIALMDYQRQLVGGVLDLWRKLPSISCTPMFHPILPLLVNFEHARRSLEIPEGDGVAFAWPEDALRQLQEARDTVEAILGVRPEGLWPSEGAVSPEAMALAAQAGFSWFVTDQAQLERAERDGAAAVDIRHPWRVEAGPVGLFRDQELSDRISFVYATWPGEKAVHDLLERAAARSSSDSDSDSDSGSGSGEGTDKGEGGGGGVVVLALDGENPWEVYPDAGEGFLSALFGSGACVTAGDVAARSPAGVVRRLHTGSWIGGNLAVWAGDGSDRRAWRQVAAARSAWEAAGCPEAAWRHLAAAEGSDWFWWFGPEFHSDEHALFDGLFRAHLQAAWRAMGHIPPASLDMPIGGER